MYRKTVMIRFRSLSSTSRMACLEWCWCLPRKVLINLVGAYRLLLSPWLGACCRFEPTCSAYALQALGTRGALVGTGLTVYRLIRCNPWCAGGHDPVRPSQQVEAEAGKRKLFSSLITRLNSHSSSEKTSSLMTSAVLFCG